MIPAEDDQRIVQLAQFLQAPEQQANRGVQREDLTEVVGKIFAHLGHIGKEGRHLADQVVRVEAPQRRSRTADPGAVHIGRSEPVGEGLSRRATLQEGLEVPGDLGVELLFGRLERDALADQPRDVLRKGVEAAPGRLELVLATSIRRIVGVAGAPDLVGLAEVIAGVTQQKRIRRDRRIPDGATQDGAAARAPEVLAGQQGAAAWGAGRSRDKRAAEQRALARHPVDIRRPSAKQIIDGARAIQLGIAPRVPAPVIGKDEDDVGAVFTRLRAEGGERKQGQEKGKEGEAHGANGRGAADGWHHGFFGRTGTWTSKRLRKKGT